MPMYGSIDMSKTTYNRLMMFQALTPALEAEGWRDLASAPKDGTEVELRVVHHNAAYESDDMADAIREGWIAACPGKWTDHNGGGWTWKYLCGAVCQWRPGTPGAFDAK